MRISYWSSDVCSSDLGIDARIGLQKIVELLEFDPGGAHLDLEIFEMAERIEPGMRLQRRLTEHIGMNIEGRGARTARLADIGQVIDLPIDACGHQFDFGLGVEVAEEIGRASCRERVCHYA